MWLGAGGVVLTGMALAIFVFEVQTAFYDVRVDDAFERAGAMKLLARGSLHPVAHAGQGTAEIYEGGGKCTLRLTDFAIDNGPALRLRLVDLADAKDDDAVKSAPFVDLGPLKGNLGNQTYDLPVAFDEAKHRALVVWCERFSVNFVTAPLSAP